MEKADESYQHYLKDMSFFFNNWSFTTYNQAGSVFFLMRSLCKGKLQVKKTGWLVYFYNTGMLFINEEDK